MMRIGQTRQALRRKLVAFVALVAIVLAAPGPNLVPTHAGGVGTLAPTRASTAGTPAPSPRATATEPCDQATAVAGAQVVPTLPCEAQDATATAQALTAEAVMATAVPTGTPTPQGTLAPSPAATAEQLTSTGCDIRIVSVTSPVAPGDPATLVAQTAPGASTAIAVFYPSGLSTAEGLEPKTADSQGNVTWTWVVGTDTTPGTWPIQVTCASGGGSGVADTTFQVGQASTSRRLTPTPGSQAVQASMGAGVWGWLGDGIRSLTQWIGRVLRG